VLAEYRAVVYMALLRGYIRLGGRKD